MSKKYFTLIILLLSLNSCKVFHKNFVRLDKITWNHGSANCLENTDPPIQLVRYNYNTWILRQNKCINYEAPFLFLFLGTKKALLMDTGATEDENKFPLYETVRKLIDQWEKSINKQVELIVAHTHAHGDHTAGDPQFKNKSATTVVGLTVEEITTFFKFENWPLENSEIDLGNRLLKFIPIPGHHKASIAVYDAQTKLLLTGDSFYPGRLYIQDWQAFKLSTQRLSEFIKQNKISYILGNHIEMTKTPGKDYPRGTTFQPNEHNLPMNKKDLLLLNKTLQEAGEVPTYKILDNFIIYPK